MFNVPLLCTGCSACVNICPNKCIKLASHEDGFLYPEVDYSKCINCSQCEKVCPVKHKPEFKCSITAFAVKNKNDSERASSSSGGVFPLLAEVILKRNGIVFGAAYRKDFSVHHIAVENKSSIHCLQGAKYVQSELGTCFKEIKKQLISGRIVLFSGTPCQCLGLNSYLGKSYDNLYMVDVICHGVPSPKAWQSYIEYRCRKENNGVRPININMRSKKSGWSRYGYSTEFYYRQDHITNINNKQDFFMKAFIGNICLRNSCSSCIAKGVQRCTDFTLGDYWGIWNQHPEFDDDKGTSVLFVYTDKGSKLFNVIRDKIECLEVEIEDAYHENGSLLYSSQAHEKRKDFLTNVTNENFDLLVKKYLHNTAVQKKVLLNLFMNKVYSLFK